MGSGSGTGIGPTGLGLLDIECQHVIQCESGNVWACGRLPGCGSLGEELWVGGSDVEPVAALCRLRRKDSNVAF